MSDDKYQIKQKAYYLNLLLLKDELKYGATPQNKMLFDATIDWVKHPIREDYDGRRYPPLSTETLPEIKDLVSRRWKAYGL